MNALLPALLRVATATQGCAQTPPAPQTPQAPAASAASEESQKVADGGVLVEGWKGQIDAKEAAAGQVLANSKLAKMGDGFHVTTGPAVVYWSDANRAMGDYTVSATFNEPKYMSINSHPHPYGIVIGGGALAYVMADRGGPPPAPVRGPVDAGMVLIPAGTIVVHDSRVVFVPIRWLLLISTRRVRSVSVASEMSLPRVSGETLP